MKQFTFLLVILLGFFCSTCNKTKSEDCQGDKSITLETGKPKVGPEKSKAKTAEKVTILIQPFQNFPTSATTAVASELKKMYSGTVKVNDESFQD
jgi:hypothetical protein